MPTFSFTSPDGKTYDIAGPDGATQEQAFQILQKQLASAPKEAPPAAPAAKPATTAKERGTEAIKGIVNARNDPGMKAFVQGAVPEAGGPGAALNAAGKLVPQAIKAPIAAGADWLDQALGTAAGKVKNALGAKSAEQRAADVIRKSASDYPTARQAIADAASGKTKDLVKGTQQTTAAHTKDEGLLGLQKTVQNMPGATERMGREVSSPANNARANVVDKLAGDADKLTALKGVREGKTNALYRSADAQRVNVDSQFKELLERPSMKKAVADARRLAQEANDPLGPGDLMTSSTPKTVKGTPAGKILGPDGKPLTPAGAPSAKLQVSGKALHYMKMALDQQLERTPANSISNTSRRLVTQTRDKFLNWTEERIPEYKAAKEQFRQLSKPINRMEIMQKIQAKATSNATDAAGNKIITRNGYQNAVKQYRKELERTLTPAQLKAVDRISADLDKSEKVNSPYIKPAGSETIRHANAQSAATFLGKLTGGQGATAALTHLVSMAPGFNWLRAVPPERVRELLVDAMLDPKAADKLLGKATPQNLASLSDTLQGLAKELGIGEGAATVAGRTAAGLAQPTSAPSQSNRQAAQP